MGRGTKLVDWLIGTRLIKRPRFWDEEEWNKLSNKEQVWVFYKHHWTMIGVGNGELDNVLFFLKGEFITQAAIMALIVNAFGLPYWAYFAYPALYGVYKYVQWWVGNKIDKEDLIAMNEEIMNRRNKVFREIRQRARGEPWRKNARLLYKKKHKESN